MNLFDFYIKFPTEQSCERHLKEKREEEGLVCEKCNHGQFYWIETRKIWKCKKCGTSISLTAGTMMEKSKVALKKWFQVVHLMTSTKKPLSALEVQRQIGEKFYETIWYMMQKIRITMGKRDAKYKLQGDIEIDDAFFEVVNPSLEKYLPQKRGRGSERQSKVLVMVESRPNPKQKNPDKKKRILGFAKMIVIDELDSTSINYEVQNAISPTSVVISDGYKSYAGLGEIVKEHKAMVVPKDEAHEKLPWVHTIISNSKREFLGTHHSIGKAFLQNYLFEFCYKLNRRTFASDLFDRMIVAGAHDTWY